MRRISGLPIFLLLCLQTAGHGYPFRMAHPAHRAPTRHAAPARNGLNRARPVRVVLAARPVLRAAPAAPPAVIEAVRAAAEGDATLLDIALRGRTTPVLADENGRLVVTLPHSAPSPGLAANLASGGLVSRIALEMSPHPPASVRLLLALGAPARAKLVQGPDRQTLRLRIASTPGEMPLAPLRPAGKGLYDVDASRSDISGLLRSLAQDAGINVVMVGTINSKVTAHFRQLTFEEAIDALTKSANLTYRKNGDTYAVGAAKDMEAAYLKPQPEAVMKQEVYSCRYISASDLVSTLEKMFDKDKLHVTLGPSYSSPHLDGGSSGNASGGQSGGASSGGKSGASGANSGTARSIILSGEQSLVARAIALAQQMDVRRQQVKIDVRITDISTAALKDLGVQWSYSNYTITERPDSVKGLSFGKFTHSPISFDATIAALESNNGAKLLAAPSLTLLDGEHGYILIGERRIFPRLVGYTPAQTPIFDKDEVQVGVLLQVAVQMSGNNEVTLMLYPQISTVTGFLVVNGASYPQISTREQQTTIRVKDGERIVVGGLLNDDEINNIQRVPVLSRIPIFGELFTYRKKSKTRSEVIITITPQILKD